MPKIKTKLKPPELDMNPMVDLAFLLVTFFMLTTTFRSEEPVQIDTPSSTSEIKVPEKNIMTITISPDERVFFSIDGKFARDKLLRLVGSQYGVSFTDKEIRQFSLISSFGMPVSEMKTLLNLHPAARKEFEQPGIPCDSLQNELRDWIVFSRMTNPKLRIAIKGDEDAKYPIIQRIMTMLVDNNITRFNLITDLERELTL